MSGETARLEAAIVVRQTEVDRLQTIADPIGARVEELDAQIEAAKEAGTPYADLIRTKAPIKLSFGAAVATLSRETGELKKMGRRMKRVSSLEADEARVIGLMADAEAARANVPDAVADIFNPREINKDTMSKEDVALLKLALRAEDKRNIVQNAIATLYTDVGLVGLRPVGSRDFGGFMLAILLGITGIALSLPIGIVLALGRQSDLLIVKTLCVGFIEFIRGVPLITLLFVASVLLGLFLPKGTEFDIILRVMIMITFFASAYMAEVIRGGLAALPTGQYEAADALGLDYWQAQRLIIMPQALKISIPSIVSNFIGLFKDTTLVSIIALSDPIGWVKLIQGNAEWNSIVWELYGFVAFVFFLFCFSMSRYSMYLERKLQTGH
jgi:His/Glu/Gln/Arg/opine family amino acid ABC transporter permease subunit